MKDRIEIGNRLEKFRKSLGLSQKELGKAINISWRTYQNYEVGTREVSAYVMIMLVQEFDLNPTWLLIGKGLPTQSSMNAIAKDNYTKVFSALIAAEKHDLSEESNNDIIRNTQLKSSNGIDVDDTDIRIWLSSANNEVRQ